MSNHNDIENESINQSIPVTTIARLFKELSFKDPQTRITLSTLELSSEYIKLFINEAIIRANEERIDEGDTLIRIDGIDNVASTTSRNNHEETQYPTIDEIEDSMRIDDYSNNINIDPIEEDDDDLIDDDYFQDESDTQRQLRQAMNTVNNTTRNNNNNKNGTTTTTTTTNNNNTNHAENILDSRHLAKIAGILTLDF